MLRLADPNSNYSVIVMRTDRATRNSAKPTCTPGHVFTVHIMSLADRSCRLHGLDTDTHTRISACLDPVSLARLSCTCKAWQAVASQNELWKRHTTNRWRFLNWPIAQDRSAARYQLTLEPTAAALLLSTRTTNYTPATMYGAVTAYSACSIHWLAMCTIFMCVDPPQTLSRTATVTGSMFCGTDLWMYGHQMLAALCSLLSCLDGMQSSLRCQQAC